MSPAEAQLLGDQQTRARIEVIARAHGRKVAAAYAAGMAVQARDQMREVEGPRRAYHWFQRLADQCLRDVLARD